MEHVVLIDETDAEVGEGEKLDVHRTGALHRAFSVFAFNAAGELLLQRRALGKYHSGGLWTNSAGGRHGLAGPRVTARAVRPQPARVVLAERAPLQQQIARLIEREDGERAVQRARAVDVELFALAHLRVRLVDQHHVFHA